LNEALPTAEISSRHLFDLTASFAFYAAEQHMENVAAAMRHVSTQSSRLAILTYHQADISTRGFHCRSSFGQGIQEDEML
jgi:hypothetical protein